MAAMSERSETVVGARAWEQALVWVGFPVLGVLAGWLVKALAGWASTLPWVPFQGPLRLLASIPEPWATLGALVLGGAVGLVVAFIGHQENLTVTVSADTVTLRRGESSRELAAGSIDGAFVDGKRLVLLGPDTGELAREQTDLDTGRLRDAFTAHGFTWHDADPHREAFRPWVEDSPDLSGSAHALLKARRRALAKDKKDDAAELRDELGKLGVVVREDKQRQYWRQVGDRIE